MMMRAMQGRLRAEDLVEGLEVTRDTHSRDWLPSFGWARSLRLSLPHAKHGGADVRLETDAAPPLPPAPLELDVPAALVAADDADEPGLSIDWSLVQIVLEIGRAHV